MSRAFPMSDLLTFPRPSVAVDVAVCTVVDGTLSVLLQHRRGNTEHGRWALPGSFVRERERLDGAVRRTLSDKCGIVGLSPTQLRVMDDPKRDDRGWVLSVAFLDVVDADALSRRSDGTLVRLAAVRDRSIGRAASILDLPDRQRRLPFDHELIVEAAVTELRRRYDDRPDPAGLLGEPFTLLQLRRLHDAIAGGHRQKDTFRRSMTPHLIATDEFEHGTVGRPARLFRRAD